MNNPSLRIHAPGLVRLEEYSRPALQDGEVGVAVHYVALCGSDIKLYHGAYKAPHRYPVVLGHEWVGVVEETTPAAAPWRIGDVVTGECSLYCGECPQCAKDPNHCRRIESAASRRTAPAPVISQRIAAICIVARQAESESSTR